MKIRYVFGGFDWVEDEKLADAYQSAVPSIISTTEKFHSPEDDRALLVVLGCVKRCPEMRSHIEHRIYDLNELEVSAEMIIMVSPFHDILCDTCEISVIKKFPRFRKIPRPHEECRNNREFERLWRETISRAIANNSAAIQHI